jgi:hypothetical protein
VLLTDFKFCFEDDDQRALLLMARVLAGDRSKRGADA